MIYDILYDWQKKLVDKFAYKRNYGLFLDMGLGKTPLGMAFAEHNDCEKVIVITINSKAIEDENVKGSWLWWAKQSKIPYVFKTKKDIEFKYDEPTMLLVNYESLFSRDKNKKEKTPLKENIINFIKSCYQQKVAIIVDESHKMKNIQSQQTSAIMKIKDKLKINSKELHTYLLTGTPFTTGYLDLYAQLKMLGCDLNKTQFVDNFCVRGNIPGLLGWQQPIVGYKNIDQLFNLIHQYAITIKSEEILNNLPEQIPPIYYVSPMSKDFINFISEKMNPKDIIENFKKYKIEPDKDYLSYGDKRINNPFYRNIEYPNNKWLADTPGNFWLRARQLSIGFQGNAEECKWYDRRRLNQLEEFLKENEDNYLLFYNYTPELLEIYSICEKLGYNIDVYCGEVKSLTFYNIYSNSNESDKLTNKKNIILANFSSGSTGLNFQEYNKCIIFSCPLYLDYSQGIKRIHRVGQKNKCFYYVFYQDNWLDKNMNKALAEKIDYSEKMFESDLERINHVMEEENENKSKK